MGGEHTCRWCDAMGGMPHREGCPRGPGPVTDADIVYTPPMPQPAPPTEGDGPRTIHSAFCGECGGWSDVVLTTIAPHEVRISCFACGESLLIIRSVEP